MWIKLEIVGWVWEEPRKKVSGQQKTKERAKEAINTSKYYESKGKKLHKGTKNK